MQTTIQTAARAATTAAATCEQHLTTRTARKPRELDSKLQSSSRLQHQTSRNGTSTMYGRAEHPWTPGFRLPGSYGKTPGSANDKSPTWVQPRATSTPQKHLQASKALTSTCMCSMDNQPLFDIPCCGWQPPKGPYVGSKTCRTCVCRPARHCMGSSGHLLVHDYPLLVHPPKQDSYIHLNKTSDNPSSKGPATVYVL